MRGIHRGGQSSQVCVIQRIQTDHVQGRSTDPGKCDSQGTVLTADQVSFLSHPQLRGMLAFSRCDARAARCSWALQSKPRILRKSLL
jgi:hypothetical protein